MVQSLKEHLVEGTILAAAIVWLFLLSVRSTIIISLAIPVSLMGAIAVMYFFGYTFNSVTLLALLLLIGVVVDDAIVVLENIFRHREELDPDPMSAAVNGANEVGFAVLAASLSLVCIFAPVIFLGGVIGQFFKSFAVVVTFGVLVSLFVSLTLTPMLCSRFLVVSHGSKDKENFIYRFIRRCFDAMDRFYRRMLELSLRWRWVVVLVAAAISASSVYFFREVPKALAPDQDEGRFIVRMRAPLGSSIEYTNDKLKHAEEIVSAYPELVSEFAIIGLGSAGQVNQASIIIRMTPKSQRKRSQGEVITLLRRDLQRIPGVRAFAAPFGIVQGQRQEPLQFVITGPNINEVGRISGEIQRIAVTDPELGRLDTDLQLNLPQIAIQPDRTRAAGLSLTSSDISTALNMMTGGIDIAKYNDEDGDGQRYDVRVKARDADFRNVTDFSKIFLRNRQGQLVRLDAVVQPKETLGPAVIARYNLQFSATFYGTPQVGLGQAVEKIRAAVTPTLPPGYSLEMIGQAKELGRTSTAAAFAFGLALVLLYMVLASQFNSFIQPLIIMVAVPLAIVGGVFALWLSQPVAAFAKEWFGKDLLVHTLNIYSMIGLVLLIGLVAKNSILLVDLTNQRRAEGMDINAALRNACPTRMRPVLMTSLTIILALLPAALGFGAGNETNGPLAVAVIGGMISSTLLTLVVVPAIYSLVEGGMGAVERVLPKRWRKQEAHANAHANAPAHGPAHGSGHGAQPALKQAEQGGE
jgi:hydrophobic/amphiphilic exporter-1 (mainly G- bacteria), HAE1 family